MDPPAQFQDEDLVPVSALEHWSYCPRQCALIHVEQTFDENLYTLRGRMLHENVDVAAGETQEGVRVERALPIWSRRLGLIGKADVVEFRNGVPYPVEYKVGPRRGWPHEALQVCAQGLCLEEMTGREVAQGAIYYHGSRRRREVLFNEALRSRVAQATEAIRAMLASARLPPAVNDARCRHCSLFDSCLPSVLGSPARLRALRAALFKPA